MNRRGIVLVGVILVAGTVAFCVGRAATVPQYARAVGGRPQWLENVPETTVQVEQRFEEQARRLADAIRKEQMVLASMLPDGRVTGEQILAQVESVNQSYAMLAKSVGTHLTDLRDALPRVQRQRLMLSCTNSLQGSMQRRYRWRGGAQDQGEGFMGGRRGGPGQGAGQGAGYGRQYRGGRGESPSGLARRLQLTQEQSTWIQRQDPNFEGQCALLRDRLYEVHAALVVTFENPQATEQEFAARVDALIEAQGALERRVAQYIVLLRPQLSQEQMDRLWGLCQRRSGAGGDPALTGPGHLGDIMAGVMSEPVLAGLL